MDPIINLITMKAKISQVTISRFSWEHVSTSASIESLFVRELYKNNGEHNIHGEDQSLKKYNVELARRNRQEVLNDNKLWRRKITTLIANRIVFLVEGIRFSIFSFVHYNFLDNSFWPLFLSPLKHLELF